MNSLMKLTTSETLVLLGLFDLARADRAATVGRLWEQTLLSRETVVTAIDRLEACGYADRAALRLTLPGLAVAVALASRVRRAERSRRLAA